MELHNGSDGTEQLWVKRLTPLTGEGKEGGVGTEMRIDVPALNCIARPTRHERRNLTLNNL